MTAARELSLAWERLTAMRFLLGSALHEAGHAEQALPQFEAVLERQPASVPARVALAEALASLRRYDEAAAAAAAVPDDAPLAGPARRAELFALIVSGARARTEEVLARTGSRPENASARGLAPRHARPGAAGSAAGDSVELLVTALEALLRVEEVEAFVALLPALDRVGLPWRERRELLAAMYMRRGYLESAADEWITVCNQGGPDEGALVGLAQGALARDLPDDAVVIAHELERIVPAHGGRRASSSAMRRPEARSRPAGSSSPAGGRIPRPVTCPWTEQDEDSRRPR